MHKEKLINELSQKLNCDTKYSEKICEILEENFIIGRNNKEKMINNLISKLDVNKEEADNIYNMYCEVIASEIKNKITHPFN